MSAAIPKSFNELRQEEEGRLSDQKSQNLQSTSLAKENDRDSVKKS